MHYIEQNTDAHTPLLCSVFSLGLFHFRTAEKAAEEDERQTTDQQDSEDNQEDNPAR